MCPLVLVHSHWHSYQTRVHCPIRSFNEISNGHSLFPCFCSHDACCHRNEFNNLINKKTIRRKICKYTEWIDLHHWGLLAVNRRIIISITRGDDDGWTCNWWRTVCANPIVFAVLVETLFSSLENIKSSSGLTTRWPRRRRTPSNSFRIELTVRQNNRVYRLKLDVIWSNPITRRRIIKRSAKDLLAYLLFVGNALIAAISLLFTTSPKH